MKRGTTWYAFKSSRTCSSLQPHGMLPTQSCKCVDMPTAVARSMVRDVWARPETLPVSCDLAKRYPSLFVDAALCLLHNKCVSMVQREVCTHM